ncbi:MAG: alpha-amylase family glycosyl hydrolase [Alistipes sp.]
MKRILLLLLSAVMFVTCCTTPKQAEPAAHPEWAYNAVVYELNVRQATPEGTFAAVENRLPALKELGVDVLWLMPIHPIGIKERKGTMGSYYAIKDYYAINPEFGTMADFDHLLARAHEMGFKVILDYVANHTSPDAAWVTEKPKEWYVRDSTGAPAVQYDWTDIAKLNYDNAEVRVAMADVLTFWLGKGVDGFRCDAAKEMPDAFWREAFTKLRAANPDIYLLAEAEGPDFHNTMFDATYAWELHHLMNDMAQGKKGVIDLKGYLEKSDTLYPREAFRLMFTSNHDENSWAGTEFERMGVAAQTMAALTYVLPNGQPLIYTGQEVGFNRRFEFFEKDPIESWEPNEYTDLYTKLNALRHANKALAAGERGGKLVYMTGVVDNVLAFTREVEGNKVFCLFNLSAEPANVIYTVAVAGDYTNAMTGEKQTVTSGEEISLPAWSYLILTK